MHPIQGDALVRRLPLLPHCCATPISLLLRDDVWFGVLDL
jgi:hypothetical protein